MLRSFLREQYDLDLNLNSQIVANKKHYSEGESQEDTPWASGAQEIKECDGSIVKHKVDSLNEASIIEKVTVFEWYLHKW